MTLNTVTVVLAVITLFSLHVGQSQGITCFAGSFCNGNSFSSLDSTTCCFGTGYSYNDGRSCRTCIVIGWKNASMPDGSINTATSFELEERYLAHKFVVGCLKGNIGHATFNVLPAYTEDFYINQHAFTMFRCTDVIVNLFLEVDNRAMEPNQELTLTLVPGGTIDAIIVNKIKITIIDTDVVNLGFNECDRCTTEGDGPLNIKVIQMDPIKTFDSNVIVQLIPVDYKYAIDNGIVSPSRYSYDPDTPNRAKGGLDYNSSPITLTFLGGTRDLEADGNVEIIDDSVDEVRQFFFVLLKVLYATNIDRINLTRSIIECNIDDNDDTYLSFESSYYMFPETSVGAGIYFIHIIKNRQSSTTETENTYELIVQVKSVDKAEKDKDFSAISISQIIFANEVKIAYVFIIFNDIIPEENESFIIKISPVANKLQWVNGRSVTTNITIIDDDGQSPRFLCYIGDDCRGAIFPSSDSSSCCFGTGYSYNYGSSCQACVVIGWKNASMPDGSINTTMTFRLEENSLAHKFQVGCLKGNINFATLKVQPETETSDYAIEPHALTLLGCSDMNVNLLLKADGRAMEQDEIIYLTLRVTQTEGSKFQGVFVINVSIIDSDVVTLGFNQDEYFETEANEAFDVVVRQLEPRKVLDSDIVLRLIPMDYTFAINNGFYTGEKIPFNPIVPNRAVGGVDYNETIIECVFPAGNISMRQVSKRVDIYDDTIDEALQFFFVLLEVKSATNKNRVKLTTPITKCNINDNDAECIPNCQNSGKCTEPNICKCPLGWSGHRCQIAVCLPGCHNGGTCLIPGVCLCPPGWCGERCEIAECYPACDNGGNCTLPGVCQCPQGFSGIGCSKAECVPNCQNGGICTKPGVCTCSSGWHGDRCQIAFTIGFTDDTHFVNEEYGKVSLMVVLHAGQLTESKVIVVHLDLRNGNSSGGEDYEQFCTELIFSEDFPEQIVNISIINDNITELNETFFAHLTLVSPECESDTILLSPNETEVEIKDDDSAVVGFKMTYHLVTGRMTNVNLNIAVLDGAIGTNITLSVSTEDIISGDQRGYVPLINEILTIQPNKATAGVLVTILNGVGYEGFTAHLSLVSPLSDRITVSPATALVYIIH